MKPDIDDLLKKALALPPEGRAALAGSLLESLDEEVDASAEENLYRSPYERDFPPKQTVAAGLKALADRGVRFFNFFSNDYYYYRGQYRDCFREIKFGDRLRIEFIPGADHLVSGLADQQYVVSAMSDWVRYLRPPRRTRDAGTPPRAGGSVAAA